MGSTSIKDDQGFKGLFPLGTLIHSRYEILSEGKMGGMGIVYKCRDTRHTTVRETALKLMQPKYLDSKDAVERFRHEAAISRDLLDHPNIVRVFHDDEWDDGMGTVWHYILMEWVEGRNLRDLISERKKSGRPFTMAQVNRIISQLSEALTYAHNHPQKVIHRDVKPENILITDEAALTLKLADFGIAKIVSLKEIGRNSTPFGISPYMSPELKAAEGEVDHRTDVYSVGVVFYELLTLENTIGPYCPSELNRAVPPDLDGIYKKAVAPRLDQRYRTVKALSDDLASALTRKEPQEGGTWPGEPLPPPIVVPRPKRRLRKVMIALLVVILLGGGVAAYVAYQDRPEQQALENSAAAARERARAEEERREEEKKKEAEARAESARRQEQAEQEKRAREEAAKPTLPAPGKTVRKKPKPAPLALAKPAKPWRSEEETAPSPLPRFEPVEKGRAPETPPKPVPELPRAEDRLQGQGQPKQGFSGGITPQPRAETGVTGLRPGAGAADDHYGRGLDLMQGRHFLQAVTEFSRALEINRDHELSLYRRGIAYFRLGNYARALPDFTQAIRLRPRDNYFHWRGVTYFRLRNYYMAVDDFTTALRIRPNYLDYRWRGTSYHRLGRYMEAEADFAMAPRYRSDPGEGFPDPNR